MLKKIIALALVTGSLATHAQSLGERMDRVGNKMEGTFPEVRAAQSKDDLRFHMGLTAGVNSPDSNLDNDESAEYGINVGFQPLVPFGVGAEITTTELDDGTNDQRTSVLARGTYNFGGDIPILKNMWLGAAGGPVIIDNKFEWAVAPTAGFDIPLSTKMHDVISIGLNAKYMYISNVPDSLVAAAAVKYWY